MTNRDRTNLAIVILVPALLWLACWPFADVPINDDFSYSHKVKRLLETGRFTYNGWSDAFIGAQALWAAAYARAFGFSHDVLRASTLPFSVACAAIAYGLFRRLAIGPAWSLFATLAIVASPLFTPWSASFMTDVQGLALWIGVLHGTISLTRARSTRETFWAATVVGLFGLLGGSVRQVPLALAGVLLGVEFVRRTLLARRDPDAGRGRAILVAWGAALFLFAVALSVWTARQPYSVAEGWPDYRRVIAGGSAMLSLTLELALYLLPLSLALIARTRVSRREWLLLLAILVLCVAATAVTSGTSRWSSLARAPFVGGTIFPTGLTSVGIDAPGERPIVFPLALRIALAAVSIWTVALAALRVAMRVDRGRSIDRARVLAWCRSLDPAIGAFALVAAFYWALIYPRATHGWTFDRYLLVVLPIVAIFAIRAAVPRGGPGGLGWATLVAFAVVGVLVTNDHFRELRARVAVARDFAARGVGPTRYSNGLGFDMWTQMAAWGYVNDYRIRSPADAFRESDVLKARRQIYYFLPRTPAITPEWIVECARARPADGTPGVESVWSYRGLLPPGPRWLVVRRDPLQAAGQPFTTRPVEPPPHAAD